MLFLLKVYFFPSRNPLQVMFQGLYTPLLSTYAEFRRSTGASPTTKQQGQPNLMEPTFADIRVAHEQYYLSHV